MIPCSYRIGIDVGQRGIGLAAIEVSTDGNPLRVLSMLTARIDGGILPGSEKSPTSRKAAAGVARRTRRLYRRRKQRLEGLDQLLRRLGYPVPIEEIPQTYEAWAARSRLVEQKISDPQERDQAVSMALRHIARHRGWRNPWSTWNTFMALPSPSENLTTMLEAAGAQFGRDLSGSTVGQLGFQGANRDALIRPRSRKDHGLHTQGVAPLFSARLRQEDHVAEIRRIWDVQGLPADQLDPVLEYVFAQRKASVKIENIGRDHLPGMGDLIRAPRAALEFQEFRIVHAVSNLKIKVSKGERRALTDKEQQLALELLRSWHQGHEVSDTPSWRDVAEAIDVDFSTLVPPAVDDVLGQTAPSNRTLARLQAKAASLGKSAAGFRSWLKTAAPEELSSLVLWLSDVTDAADLAENSGISDLLASWDDSLLDEFSAIEFEAGRSTYSLVSLQQLSNRMISDRITLDKARSLEFGVPLDWRPPPPSLYEPTGHPTVDQNLTAIRRFVMACVRRWGMPQAVALEHVRGAFLSPVSLQELKNNQRQDLRDREQAEQELLAAGHEVTRRNTYKLRYLQRQNSQCAYCGTKISMTDAELDHIVPRRGGGASTRANLVAACRACNKAKGKLPFTAFAQTPYAQSNNISLDGVLERIRGWSLAPRVAARRKIQRELVQRLKQTQEDPPLDERSLESTAYTAREVRERVKSFLSEVEASTGELAPEVMVYRGSIISAARKASGIDKELRLRGRELKDRSDFRHHAVDAAVIAMMDVLPAQVLAIREGRRAANLLSEKDPEWSAFPQESWPHYIAYQKWRKTMKSLVPVVGTAFAEDSVAVTYPLRLSRKVGRIHEDTVRPLDQRPVLGEWSAQDLKRVVDRESYLLIKQDLREKTLPAPLGEKTVSKVRAATGTMVKIFGSNAAQIPVRKGSAKLGAIHHARILAWRTPRGVLDFGLLRVFSGELNTMWPESKTNLLSAEVPEWSMSRRDVTASTEQALATGIAQQIGWLAPGDEIEINPDEFKDKDDKLGEFLRLLPESRWTLTSVEDATRITIRPRYLSSENPGGAGAANDQPPEILAALGRGVRASIRNLLKQHGTRIIRRNAAGEIRWGDNGQQHLPVSIEPASLAEQLVQKSPED